MSQVLLVGGQVFFSRISHFHPILGLTQLKKSEIILTDRKTQIKKNNNKYEAAEELKSLYIVICAWTSMCEKENKHWIAHLHSLFYYKTNKMTCGPSKESQISLGIHPVWSAFTTLYG